MTSIIVFVGPSLHAADRSCEGVEFRPPARQGDVLRCLVQDAPDVIGLIDGYFGTMLAVHQKELIDAMAQGVAVLGAASMGALRAAELDGFGMIGIGGIYQDYASGRLVSDADVAVAHAPAELGFGATSLAMVDLRATLEAASAELTPDLARQIRLRAEAVHFAERTFSRVVDGLGGEAARAEAILKAHHVERKRADALALLDAVSVGEVVTPKPGLSVPMTREYKAIRRRALRV